MTNGLKSAVPAPLRAVLATLIIAGICALLTIFFINRPAPPVNGAGLLEIIGQPLNERRVRRVFSGLGMDWRAGNSNNHAAGKPVEIQVELNRLAGRFEEKGYVKLIRIGSQDRRLPPVEVDSLYPYGITSAMTPPEIIDLCRRPYSPSGELLRTPDGTHRIEFFDGPGCPMPITVWFKNGKVCGVDIQTWGPE